MEIIRLNHPHPPLNLPATAVALGFFDGVHRGHQKVIEVAKKEAENQKIKSAVMTFYPHPREVLRKQEQQNVFYLSPLEEKEKLIADLGIEYLFIIQFDTRFADLSPQQFVDQYLIDLNIKHVIAGFDYTYGRLGKGTMETLPFHSRKRLTQTTVGKMTNEAKESEKISSTAIREALQKGNIEKVNDFLGRNYHVSGVVEHGEKRGRTIGFPTANIRFSERVVIPQRGVYAVTIFVDEKWRRAVCNIGYKPTFHNETEEKPTLEVHLLNFQGDLYDLTVTVAFQCRIREEKKFDSVEELTKQIDKDVELTTMFFTSRINQGKA